MLDLSKNRAAVSMPRTKSTTVSDSQEEEHEDSSEMDMDNYESDDVPSRRMSTRSRGKQSLPFSPRKTRTQRVYLIDPDEEPEGEEDRHPARRSARVKKGVKVNLYTEIHTDDEPSDEDSDDYRVRQPKSKGGKSKNSVRGKASRPAYGHIRDVKELDYDFSSGDEDAPLRSHRRICERCQKGPAHQLLSDFSKKGKSKARKRKTPVDEFDDTEDEGERLAVLGGWVRWYAVTIVYARVLTCDLVFDALLYATGNVWQLPSGMKY